MSTESMVTRSSMVVIGKQKLVGRGLVCPALVSLGRYDWLVLHTYWLGIRLGTEVLEHVPKDALETLEALEKGKQGESCTWCARFQGKRSWRKSTSTLWVERGLVCILIIEWTNSELSSEVTTSQLLSKTSASSYWPYLKIGSGWTEGRPRGQGLHRAKPCICSISAGRHCENRPGQGLWPSMYNASFELIKYTCDFFHLGDSSTNSTSLDSRSQLCFAGGACSVTKCRCWNLETASCLAPARRGSGKANVWLRLLLLCISEAGVSGGIESPRQAHAAGRTRNNVRAILHLETNLLNLGTARSVCGHDCLSAFDSKCPAWERKTSWANAVNLAVSSFF